jgi:nickel transport protein
MPGRIPSLSPLVLPSALLALVLAAGDAHAHRLDAQAFILPNHQIQIEAWFSNGDAAQSATVQVFGAQGQRITEGHLNSQGIFIFPYGGADALKIVISAGAGHRKELSLQAGALAAPASEKAPASPVQGNELAPTPVPLAERDSGVPVKDVLLGIGFVLAVAAFVLSLRNAQKLRTLERFQERAPHPVREQDRE